MKAVYAAFMSCLGCDLNYLMPSRTFHNYFSILMSLGKSWDAKKSQQAENSLGNQD